MDPKTKRLLVDQIRARFHRDYHVEDHRACCLHWAGLTRDHLQQATGHRMLIQAGTAMFQRLDPRDDDGQVATHYTYQFEADLPLTHVMVADNRLPEIHAWVADMETRELIDVTTGYQMHRCQHELGLTWTAAPLPDFFWGSAEDANAIPIYYRADAAACWLAEIFLKHSVRGVVTALPRGEILKEWLFIRQKLGC